jgi:hypothetical protein
MTCCVLLLKGVDDPQVQGPRMLMHPRDGSSCRSWHDARRRHVCCPFVNEGDFGTSRLKGSYPTLHYAAVQAKEER